jgi:hypothetical protein
LTLILFCRYHHHACSEAYFPAYLPELGYICGELNFNRNSEMKISEKLNKLNTSEYQEYLHLQKKSFDGEKFAIWAAVLLHLAFCFITGTCIVLFSADGRKDIWQIYFTTFLIGVILPYCWFPTIFIGVLLESTYKRTYEHFAHRTYSYQRFLTLKKYFLPIEIEIEAEAISILDPMEKEARNRLRESKDVNYDLRLKRKWQPWYANELAKVKKNCELNKDILDIVNSLLPFIKIDTKNKKLFTSLQRDLKNPYAPYHTLESKLAGLTDSVIRPKAINRSDLKPIKQGTPSHPLGLGWGLDSDESVAEPRNLTSQPNLGRERVSSTNEITLPSYSEEPKNHAESQIPLDFEKGPRYRTNEEIPVQRKGPRHKRIFKGSLEFYTELEKTKMTIGQKGELIILESERRRIKNEYGDPFLNRVIHSSVKIGDGLGYDIQSFKKDREIYIEVKTTTGSFWSNLYFTRNEFATMDSLNDQYYLYRICNFDLETNEGDLFIFEGKETILNSFDFNSQVYVLTEKSQ